MRLRTGLAALAIVPLVASGHCNGDTTSPPDSPRADAGSDAGPASGDGSGGMECSEGGGSDRSGSPTCPALDAGPPGAVPARGTVTAPGVEATLCVGVGLASGTGGDVVFVVYPTGSINLSRPCNGSSPSIDAAIVISASAPGVYSRSAPGSDGTVDFLFNLPVPAGLECSGIGPDSSPGCQCSDS